MMNESAEPVRRRHAHLGSCYANATATNSYLFSFAASVLSREITTTVQLMIHTHFVYSNRCKVGRARARIDEEETNNLYEECDFKVSNQVGSHQSYYITTTAVA
jgi:hypothetical protein